MRHVSRTHKVNLGSLYEVFEDGRSTIEYTNTNDQSSDIFTKALPPNKWEAALEMIGIIDFNNNSKTT